jgi:hypothetical protein
VKYLVLFVYTFFVFTALVTTNTPQARAVSADVVLYQLQTGSTTSASEEIVLLYNSSNEPINVTNWCLHYSSASDITKRKLSCIVPPNIQTELLLASGGVVSFASGEFVLANPGFVPDFIFSSGMAATSGHAWLENSNFNQIDRLGWGSAVLPEGTAATAHSSGGVLSRDLNREVIDTDNNAIDFVAGVLLNPITSGLYEQSISIDLCPNIEGIQLEIPSGFLRDNQENCYLDFCPNVPELQLEAPIGYEKKIGSEDCSEVVLENAELFITELLPNAPSTDSGKEFIEIYNPNNRLIELAGYSLQVGPNFTKKFTLTSGTIKANQYIVFSDTESGIVLPNTSGVSLRFVAPAGNVVFETPVYSNASDNVSWALVEDQWIYTNQPTPGGPNLPFLEAALDEVIGVTTLLAPCPLGKFRNPETNRCKTLETAVSQLKPCDEDEFRNPETNRCNKIATTSSSLTPCKAGQERNPETNRCRNIATNSALSPCPEGQERNPETNRCRKVSVLGTSTGDIPTITDVAVTSTSGSINWPVIVAVLFATFGYIIYEWRTEINHFYGRTRRKLVQ